MRRFSDIGAGRRGSRAPGERPVVPTGSTDAQFEMEGWARTVANYFTNERYSFVRALGEGAQGQAMLVNERDEVGRLLRRVVVKSAVDTFYDQDIQDEADALKRFRGCAHIAQIIALESIAGDGHDDGEEDPYGGRGLFGMRSPHAPRPVLVLEYFPNGTIFDLSMRIRDTGASIPERLLWYIILCRK